MCIRDSFQTVLAQASAAMEALREDSGVARLTRAPAAPPTRPPEEGPPEGMWIFWPFHLMKSRIIRGVRKNSRVL